MIQTINFAPGDIVRVHQKITEADKTRTQVFEGTVLAIKGRGENKMFTVRKVVGDVAVERIWPANSPNIEKVDLKSHPKRRIRRAKLYYLRKTA
ncbi:MAG: 50S ribosomal protein L19 [Candidatus Levybacteria bacterium]|nr:50S ribosomal protein L19 [Candidatus Levybacteria bacterium]